MPAIRPEDILRAILDAVQESGSSAILISPVRRHPRKFVITDSEGAMVLWVYAWTLTHGGRPSLPHEYRIQMTAVSSPLGLNPNGPTILLGYEPNLKLFAGFDLLRHRRFTTGSPSVQIDIRTLEEALQDGLAFYRKSNNEIAVGIRPDQFMTYANNAESIHKYGRIPAMFDLLERASSLEEISVEDIESLAAPRKRVVQTVSRLSRQANFRQQVLHAYGNRCAVTKTQLKLVDAAHILPVGAPDSTDHIKNGLALAPTYHRAFDTGLIYLDETYRMRINPEKESSLVTLGLDAGLRRFKDVLGRILLPPDRKQWPSKAFIRKANRFRQIPA